MKSEDGSSADDVHPRARLPATPTEISLVLEQGRYVFRTDAAMAIYTHALDTAGQSVCTDQCTKIWPPMAVVGEPRQIDGWTVIERPDGILQWAYRQQPLYLYSYDEPGAAHGDGIGGVWLLAVP